MNAHLAIWIGKWIYAQLTWSFTLYTSSETYVACPHSHSTILDTGGALFTESMYVKGLVFENWQMALVTQNVKECKYHQKKDNVYFGI